MTVQLSIYRSTYVFYDCWNYIEFKHILFPNFCLLFFFYIYKHIQFNTITYKQKGKGVEPQVRKPIYGSPLYHAS